MFQCSPSMVRTGSFPNRATGCTLSSFGPTRPSTTRPLDAPRSSAATTPAAVVTGEPRAPWASSQECGRDAGVDRDVQARGVAEIGRAEHEHGVCHVLREHLVLEKGAPRVVLAQVLLGHPVDRGPLGTPPASEDTRATHHTVRVDAIHLHAVLAELGGEHGVKVNGINPDG